MERVHRVRRLRESQGENGGTEKSKDELWGETLFRSLPRNPDGTVPLEPVTHIDYNDLMIPMNTRLPLSKTRS
jgi:hypothetical protein